MWTVNEEERAVEQLGADVDATVSRAAKTIEPGRSGFTIAVVVFVALIALLLPWAGGHPGWRMFAGDGGAIPLLFASTSTLFGVLASAAALVTRRWWLSWVCTVGCWISSVDGMLAIWSQQSSSVSGHPGDGPGIGMILMVISMVVLAVQWTRLAWSRS
ncbi:Rv2732c family membrane protein [Prauserella rugosa]|uniref:Rv2732c family membrane protein n=1 Tax=Prauserella rugosa TaxID=43354 RepID=UPI0004C4103D|nr:membrane protein [Streptomyces regensis]